MRGQDQARRARGKPRQDGEGDGAIMADLENTLYMDIADASGKEKGRVTIALRPDLAPAMSPASRNSPAKASTTAWSSTASSRASWRRVAIPPAPAWAARRSPTSRRNSRPSRMCAVSARWRARPTRTRPTASSSSASAMPPSRPTVHGVGQGDRGHGDRRHDQARRTRAPARQDRQAAGRSGREVTQ